ncbi:MAG: glucosamine-6-phosphate deaminase [Chloroflexi bacterium]|nr:glucosamine-6-phosphate deaminase [Chloroflexota bacterium]
MPGKVQVFVTDEPEEVARGAADDAAGLMRADKRAVVLFAVGESPIGVYAELAERRRGGTIDTSRIRAVQLDEYLGIPAEDERSFHGWLTREILVPLSIPRERTISLRGDARDPAAECRRYEEAVARAGGLDLAILGLGHNGHLGFNEPPSGPDAPTRVVDLSDGTIEANARDWGDAERVPRRAITAGMRVLLAARRTILVVTGEAKRAILHATLEGPITPDVPASYLRTIGGVQVYVDRAAWEADATAA